MKWLKFVGLAGLAGLIFFSGAARAEKLSIAAAADLKFALDEIVSQFKTANPGDDIAVTYGSSGKFHTQIQQGAPFDLYFSADIAFAEQLQQAGFAASPVIPYAIGRLVLWRKKPDAKQNASPLSLASLSEPHITRIAIANPKHAPYGKRAEEALRAGQLWQTLEKKLIYGENIAQTAQFVQTGNAQLGLIALSLALNPTLAQQGEYMLIPDTLHAPLLQGFIITQRAANNATARRFADYMNSPAARASLRQYGFTLPDAASHQ